MTEGLPERTQVTRRDVLGVAGGAVAGVGLAGGGFALVGGDGGTSAPGSAGASGSPSPSPSATEPDSSAAEPAGAPTGAPTDGPSDNPLVNEPDVPVRRYVSSMAVTARVRTWRRPGSTTAPGLIFATPRINEVFTATILADDGHPVWIDTDGPAATDLRVQTYQGEPVLTYWSGRQLAGHGTGVGVIKDTRYRTIATVRTGNGLSADMHEFRLTDRGTALLIVYPVIPADLRAVGGPADGYIYGARIQEIDVATGEVLLDCDLLDELDLEETYQELNEDVDGSSPARAFDPVHLNSIEDRGDTLLLSARHTHALYLVDRNTGRLIWRLGGRRSDFSMGRGTRFSWQHDARWRGERQLSLYDNHGKTDWDDRHSAGLWLELDEQTRQARLIRRYTRPGRFGGAMGNLQVLPGRHVLIGWGASNTATEFTRDGTPIYEMRDIGKDTYRVYRARWQAQPEQPPSVVVHRQGRDRMRVHVSWNGATEVDRWRILAGPSADELEYADTVPHRRFETMHELPSQRIVVVEALDRDGTTLVRSAPARLKPARAR